MHTPTQRGTLCSYSGSPARLLGALRPALRLSSRAQARTPVSHNGHLATNQSKKGVEAQRLSKVGSAFEHALAGLPYADKPCLTLATVTLQVLAAAGVASRRAAESIIGAGRVLVNDKTEVLPQRKVVPGKDKVSLHATEDR